MDIKVRYYGRDGQSMHADFSCDVVPRVGETVRLGEEGERVGYYVHRVSYYPHDDTDFDVYLICRTDRPR